ncbi:MAG TPA: histidine--tRNA ligase, partial [Phaeodactylibacter sp.]|nr:histidine--tRNA ligase [Phaeodactylibacter sp.]
GMAEAAGISEQFMNMTIAIDKLDKIGMEGVRGELSKRGIPQKAIDDIEKMLQIKSLEDLKPLFRNSATGMKGIEELETFHLYFDRYQAINNVEFDITLARGLSYYTGGIFEVISDEVKMGSLGGGGRYDDLTGVFGLKDISGVGISFGAARIYDVMEELNLFPDNFESKLQVLLLAFDEDTHLYAYDCLIALRKAGINADLYPKPLKFKKQMKYANDRKVPFVILIGEEEMKSGLLSLKDMQSGEQEKHSLNSIIDRMA